MIGGSAGLECEQTSDMLTNKYFCLCYKWILSPLNGTLHSR
jgi:hypothetical protein